MSVRRRSLALSVERALCTFAGTRLSVLASPWFGSTIRADESRRRIQSLIVVAFAINCLTAIEAYAEADSRQPNVLIVYSNDPELPAIQLLTSGLRSGFSESPTVRIFTEYFDEVRFPKIWTSGSYSRFLRDKYRDLKIDLMIGVGDDAIVLLKTERSALAPEAPIVFTQVPPGDPATANISNSTGIYSKLEIRKVLELAERLVPGAKNLVVVSGAADFDRRWERTAREAFDPLEDRYRVTYLAGLPVGELLDRIKGLPPETIVIYLSVFEDGAHKQFIPRDVLRMLAEVSPAPIFGPYDTFMGTGVAGVHSDSFEAVGKETARLALRVLGGEEASRIAPYIGDTQKNIVDGAVLERLSLSFANLPDGTVIENWAPPAWKQYRWHILGAAALILAQTLLIAYVLIENRRRRRAEFLLKESEQRMTLTAASANVGLWQYDQGANELWATDHCRSLFGLASDVPLTRDTFLAAIEPEDREAAIASIGELGNASQSVATDIRVVSPDDKVRWIRIRTSAYPDDHRGRSRLSGIFVDVTEQKAAEADAAARRQEIAHLTRVSVLGELSGAIAHEISQPLTAVQSNAETGLELLAESSPDLDEVRGALEDIAHDNRRASEVIERMRDLLRKSEKKSEAVDINETIRSTLALLHSELISRKINVTLELADTLPATFGDPVQLQQVLLNLMMNAMDAMVSTPQERRLVIISTRVAGAGRVKVIVKDCGAGIALSDQSRLFERFYTTKAHGLGLGLTICSTIVRAHGGSLALTNDEAGGAVAELSLPAEQVFATAR